jgi:DNA-binding CsgD family transcriptional regulator/tetratricopeptide (TPR) repeat protein
MTGVRPLVGRETELALLGDLLASARDGHGGLVLLTGPPGIGKTRLAEEAGREAARAGMAVSWSRCLDDEGAPPLWPFLTILAAEGGQPVEVTAALSESPAEAGEAAAARFRLVEAVTRALLAGAGPGGRLLVLEDLHAADDTTLRVLTRLAAEVAASGLLVLVTYRDRTGGTGAVAGALADAGRQRGVLTVEVGPLDVTGVGQCLAVAGVSATPDLVAVVHERTGGRPLLVQAVAAELARAGEGEPEPGPELWRRVAEAADVRRHVGTALGALDTQAREVVTAAALLGEDVDVGALIGIRAATADDVLPALEHAVAAGLMVWTAEPGDVATPAYRFAHALVRDAVAAAAEPVARLALHRRAADWFDARSASDPALAGEAARHWSAAGATPELLLGAAAAARRAAAAAGARFADDDAARWLGTALDAADRGGAEACVRAEILLELADAQYRGGRIADAVTSCDAAARAAVAAGRDDLVAAAALVVAGVQDPAVVELNERLCALALASPQLPGHLGARLHAQLADGYAANGERDAVDRHSRRALELAEASGDDRALLDALRARMLVLIRPSQAAERLEVGARAVERARRLRQPTAEVWGHVWRADAAFAVGDADLARAEVGRIARVAERTGSLLARWHRLRTSATLAELHGDFAAGLAASDEAGHLARQVGDVSALTLTLAYRQVQAALRGMPELLADGLEEIFAAAPPMPIALGATAVVQHLSGRDAESRATYERLLPVLDDPRPDTRWAGTLDYLTQLSAIHGDAATAGRVYVQLRDWAGDAAALGSINVTMPGAVARQLGVTAATAGRHEEAVSWFREAVTVNRRLGARPYTALSRLGLATALRATAAGAPGDGAAGRLAEALVLAKDAARELRRLGMPGPLRRAGEVVADLEAVARATDPLSVREREVADLVAQALSNRQIADRLVLSERTVESHVRNILGKLGFTTRTEIATWTLRG